LVDEGSEDECKDGPKQRRDGRHDATKRRCAIEAGRVEMDEYRRFAEAQGIKIRAYREGDVSRDGRGIGQSDASGKRSLGQPCVTMAGLLAR
jgi:hypothetical protein